MSYRHKKLKVLLPEAVCCCLQTCNVYIMKLAMGYIHMPSFIILHSCIYGLHHINGLYYNVWPRANSCHFLSYLQKNNYALARPVMDSNHHTKFHPCILSGFEICQSKLNNNNNNKKTTNIEYELSKN